MKKLVLSTVFSLMSFAGFDACAELILCIRQYPQWSEYSEGQYQAIQKGPALLINQDAGRVTWLGAGSQIRLTGVQNPRGIQITRVDGRATRETILSFKKTGNVSDFELQDSLGGVGLLRVYKDDASDGRATWQHATNTMNEELGHCTTNILN